MQRLRYIVFGLRNVVVKYNENTKASYIDEAVLSKLTKLLHFLHKKKIEPVVFANKDWVKRDTKQPLKEIIKKQWGDIRYYITTSDNMPPKPTSESIPALLRKLCCEENEVLYVGNTNRDMRTAVNGRVVFLNATWFGQQCTYGFQFGSPKDIAKFVDTFFCRDHLWSFKIENENLRYYSLAPYGTYDRVKELYGDYSSDARKTAKDGLGHPQFWGRYLSATLLLSGIYKEVNYICPFPAHTARVWKDPLKNSLDTFEKCFRQSYLRDLVVRHTSCLAAHKHRETVIHSSHLNTIQLNKHPTPPNGRKYKKSPLKKGKTVLVVDDFCTLGYSLEAARIYLASTGADIILFSWLKTINRPYVRIKDNFQFKFDPYKTPDWTGVFIQTHTYDYESIFTDEQAYLELKKKFKKYDAWDW